MKLCRHAKLQQERSISYCRGRTLGIVRIYVHWHDRHQPQKIRYPYSQLPEDGVEWSL